MIDTHLNPGRTHVKVATVNKTTCLTVSQRNLTVQMETAGEVELCKSTYETSSGINIGSKN